MRRQGFARLLWAGILAALLLLALFVMRRAATEPSASLALALSSAPQAPSASPASSVRLRTPTREAPAIALQPTATSVRQEWKWGKAGFSGWNAVTLTLGVEHYVYHNWSTGCDVPARHQIPIIWGKREFYREGAALAELFNGPCNDGRPLLFLNEPARPEQADISPIEAAHMFYTMTRGADWPHARWRGPIYAGNNLVEDWKWDSEFVRQFAKRYNGGNLAIPEIAGWGLHLYGNTEYGPKAGDSSAIWTEDIPVKDIPAVVDRSMRLLDEYLTQRKAEGNATSLVLTEFGFLQAPTWHTPPAFYYRTTAAFMREYVRRFDPRPEIQAWFAFISTSPKDELLDTNLMIDDKGKLTPNGMQWRELARARQ